MIPLLSKVQPGIDILENNTFSFEKLSDIIKCYVNSICYSSPIPGHNHLKYNDFKAEKSAHKLAETRVLKGDRCNQNKNWFLKGEISLCGILCSYVRGQFCLTEVVCWRHSSSVCYICVLYLTVSISSLWRSNFWLLFSNNTFSLYTF